MENNSSAPPLRSGPRPGAGPSTAPLSASRARVLTALPEDGSPALLTEIAALTGLHVNTVREHLDGLVSAGLATRDQAPPSGRGRPAWLYRATPRDVVASPEYAGLASTLASTIARTSAHPAQDAALAGREWGEDLAAQRGACPLDDHAAAKREVVELLDTLGFAPEVDRATGVVRLRECPLLDAARRHTEVVCSVHLGLVRGALAAYGASEDGTALEPFAEPGACLLHVGDPG